MDWFLQEIGRSLTLSTAFREVYWLLWVTLSKHIETRTTGDVSFIVTLVLESVYLRLSGFSRYLGLSITVSFATAEVLFKLSHMTSTTVLEEVQFDSCITPPHGRQLVFYKLVKKVVMYYNLPPLP